ncbi:hypothetical protein O4158_21125 [Gordonia amicalis]|uniref:hypothetical protein n=1 Tax=Gordonia amicalis TaxID=89053 RepID=UPI0022B3B3BC|nr:hypothetical protein [Gordonia amicalis]MCZ4581543.1 hypothetical protein [Gordonia amicalis]
MTRTRTTRHLTQTVAATAAAAALLAGCGSNNDNTDQYPSVVTSTQVQVEGSVTPSAGPKPSAAKPDSCARLPEPFTNVDACNEQSVALTALRTMYSTNPTRDTSSQDAMLRAVPLMSSAMISRIVAPTKGSQNTEWSNLKASRKRVVATVTIQTENQSTYYQINRKAVPVEADNDAPGTTLDTIAVSATLTVVDGMGYRLDTLTPIT